MTINDINLDNLDAYEYQELIKALIHYYNSSYGTNYEIKFD